MERERLRPLKPHEVQAIRPEVDIYLRLAAEHDAMIHRKQADLAEQGERIRRMVAAFEPEKKVDLDLNTLELVLPEQPEPKKKGE